MQAKNTKKGRKPDYSGAPNRGAQRLGEYLAKRHQAPLAARLGVSVAYLCNLAHGQRRPSRAIAAKLTRYCRIPAASWDEPPTPL